MIITRSKSELAEKYGISNDELRAISLAAAGERMGIHAYMIKYYGWIDEVVPLPAYKPSPIYDKEGEK